MADTRMKTQKLEGILLKLQAKAETSKMRKFGRKILHRVRIRTRESSDSNKKRRKNLGTAGYPEGNCGATNRDRYGALSKAVLFDAPEQRVAVHAKDAGCLGSVPVRLPEGQIDQVLLQAFEEV